MQRAKLSPQPLFAFKYKYYNILLVGFHSQPECNEFPLIGKFLLLPSQQSGVAVGFRQNRFTQPWSTIQIQSEFSARNARKFLTKNEQPVAFL
jgi:hypothetical protein